MKNNLVISAVNFFEGGPLSVLKDCLNHLNGYESNNYNIIALVHKKDIIDCEKYQNIQFIEFPKSRKSYFYRLYYEYFYFRKFALYHKVDFWFSLHDITPNVGKIPQAVYCHNPSPFNSTNLSDLIVQPTQFFFSLFYKYLYKINIKRNKYVVVQQLSLKNSFKQIFKLNPEKIIISKPQVPDITVQNISNCQKNNKFTFFFPTFPRPFKNIEVIGKAVEILYNNGCSNYEVIVTIDGSENKYSKKMIKKFGKHSNIKFIGLISREEVYHYFNKVDCLIFPSKLETWGLPISEFKQFEKPMLVSDLPYAKETVGKFNKVCFFDPMNANQLADQMRRQIEKTDLLYDETNFINYPDPVVNSWTELFDKLLN